jgi:hypothetical protein
MTEVELRKIMLEKNLSVVGKDITSEEKRRNMIKTLNIIIPARSPSDRVTFRNAVRYFYDASIRSGREPDDMFRILIDFALESSGPRSRNPAAVFMSILKKEFGYSGKSKTTKS